MQSRTHTLASFGAFLIGLYFIALILFLGIILPGQGFSGDENAFHTPAIALPFALVNPLRAVYHLLDLVLAVGLVLTAVALAQRLQNARTAMVRVATCAALIGAALLLAGSMLGYIGVPELARLYAQGQPEAGAAYLTITIITGALQMGAIFAFGSWVLLVCMAAATGGGLPRRLAYLGILLGATAMLNFLAETMSVLTVLLSIVWSIWLGVALIRASGSE